MQNVRQNFLRVSRIGRDMLAHLHLKGQFIDVGGQDNNHEPFSCNSNIWLGGSVNYQRGRAPFCPLPIATGLGREDVVWVYNFIYKNFNDTLLYYEHYRFNWIIFKSLYFFIFNLSHFHFLYRTDFFILMDLLQQQPGSNVAVALAIPKKQASQKEDLLSPYYPQHQGVGHESSRLACGPHTHWILV